MLEEAGFAVTGAGSAREALAQFGENVDLLVLDVRLPDLTGPELARQAWQVRSDVRVLFVSANPTGANPQDVALLRDCIIKPFTSDQLVNAVRRLLAA